jgi:hypothetical protein
MRWRSFTQASANATRSSNGSTGLTPRDVHLIFLTVDPKWDPYRGDPRFEALLARCGFTHTASRDETPRIRRSDGGPEEPTL